MFDLSPVQTAIKPRQQPVMAESGLGRLESLLTGPLCMFKPAAEIYAEGDRAGTLYQVTSGVVRVYRLLNDGRRQICAFHMSGEIFGFESGAEHHFFADAVTQVSLRILRPGSETELSHELYLLAIGSLARAHDHLLTVGRNDASGRVAAFLVEMATRQKSREQDLIELAMSRTDIADYLGLTIETVCRVLTKLKDAHIIRLETSRHLHVLRWDVLEDMMA